jgi:hypothetical protein
MMVVLRPAIITESIHGIESVEQGIEIVAMVTELKWHSGLKPIAVGEPRRIISRFLVTS